ncbi:AN1-type zinc finger protein 3-like isoform X1 [Gadus chalcogrammus]|uniref:AN1-type zinc finger protein 3-like isoform X1 n=1 Tax=Gadus chalcogrammus TaxID=1042646 RepID=UPI0024C4D985|nr:AN1-type zinc finger protein 3-like isoform X1 [Gadus chalcogrammus]
MGDTGSERSKPPSTAIPPRCPCGFWGSGKTLNRCSKCFADVQKKETDEECPPKSAPGTSNNQSDVFCNESNSNLGQSLTSTATPSEEAPLSEAGTTSHAGEAFSSTETALGTLSPPTKRPSDSASQSEGEYSPEKRARLRELPAEPSSSSSSSSASSSSSKQRGRRRCHRCHAKLELVQLELGSCRCGHVFCMLHRLPEQHHCLFDHLGRGRQDAVLKMVKLDRKVGRSCQRIGEECS